MINYNLIKEVSQGLWAIPEPHALALAPYVSGLFDANRAFVKEDHPEPYIYSGDGSDDYNGRGNVKSVAVITIATVLTKYDAECGPRGMETMGAWIKKYDVDESVSAIVLKLDSPGGMVSGTHELGETIKGCSKPIVAFVSDMACSAAYWIASCCDFIIANKPLAEVGSIGVLLSFMDVQPAYEKMGVKFHTITAPQSSDKTKRSDELKAGKYTDYKENVLRPLADDFINLVKTNRSQSTEEHFTANVFFARDVEGSLIDEINTFEYAIQKAIDMSVEADSNTNITQTADMKKVNAVVGAELEADKDGGVYLTAEQLSAVEGALPEAEENPEEPEEEPEEDPEEEVETTQKTDASMKKLKAENARLKAKLAKTPGAKSATVHKETDASGDSDSDDFNSNYAACCEFLNI